MVAGGVGLAPFVTLAERLQALGTAATLFYGARTASELYYVDLFERLGVHVVLATEDGSRGTAGRITVPLREALGDAGDADVRLYACGPTPMMRAVAGLGEASGRTVMASLEQVMGCGMGGCYSCVVRVRRGSGSHLVRSCIEGPVFDGRNLIWDSLGSGH